MKKILSLIMIAGALSIVSCTKENTNEVIIPEIPTVGRASFRAYLSENDQTKTTYLNETTFNWVGNEIVSMDLITNSNDAGNRFDFYIPAANLDPSDKTVAVFESAGTLSLGSKESGATYRLGARAYYPGQKSSDGYPVFQIGTAIKTGVGATTVNLSETLKPSVTQPMRVLPMIGNNDGADNFAFHSATGILKVTVQGLDYRVDKVQLYSSGQQLSGTFEIDSVTENEKSIECYKIGTGTTTTLSLQYVGRTNETSLNYYFPVPVGTLNAGFEIRVLDVHGTILKTAVYPSAVPITRNHISTITKPIVLSLEAAPDASALAGLYYGNASHNITLAASDNALRGNIMITACTGKDGSAFTATGKIYGYYNGTQLVFDGHQSFDVSGGNYYCVHGQGRDGSVKDVLFNVGYNGSKYTLTTTKRNGESATDFGVGKVTRWTCDNTVQNYSTTSTVWSSVTLTQQ